MMEPGSPTADSDYREGLVHKMKTTIHKMAPSLVTGIVEVTAQTLQPQVGVAITATLSDPDNVTDGPASPGSGTGATARS